MSESELASKRQRIGQACDHCRKRKSKCDGKQPTCSVCRLFKRNCTYGNAKKRGLPTGYVRGLEALLGLCNQHISNFENVVQTLIRSSYGSAKFHDAEFLDDTADIWRKSQIARDLEHLLFTRNGDTMQPATVQAIELPTLEMLLPPADQLLPEDTSERDETLNNGQSLGFEKLKELETLSAVKFPENTSDLIDFYFQTVHCWFPIVERRDILRVMYEEKPVNDVSIEDEGHRLCLWAIIAYGTALKEGPSDFVSRTNPENIQTYIRLRLALHDEAYGVGHVQATLILILLQLGKSQFRVAWMLMAQATGILMALDDEEAQKSERYLHVWHGWAYIDKLLSAILRRNSFASHGRNTNIPYLDQNGLDEWELWAPLVPQPENGVQRCERKPLRVLSIFNQLTQLTRRLSHIYEDPLEVDRLEKMVQDLQQWYNSLSKHHQLHEYRNPPLLTLHLTYNFVLLTIFREIRQIGSHLASLLEEALNSTHGMLVQYLSLTEIAGASSLLMSFGLQAQDCIEICGHALSCQAIHSLKNRYSSLLERLNRYHNNEGGSLTQLGTLQNPAGDALISLTQVTPEIRSTTETRTGRSIGNKETVMVSPDSISVTIPENYDTGSYENSNLESTSDSYLDSLYDDMLSIFPTARYDGEASQFAQNLGFLSNDMDVNNFTFQSAQQKI